ncbi:MAG: hypothetical protein AAGC65_05740 [Mucilaginibacter sp.]|uniref:hypothetical protein n=1 Tax=Mucilaginibacter sp. TaxID=1882438 RepID=UPI0031A65449
MLTIEEYHNLNEPEKAVVILQGNFLADREENGLFVQLYSISKFYGELCYDLLANKILPGGPLKVFSNWCRILSRSVLICGTLAK